VVQVILIESPGPSERCGGCVDNIARIAVDIGPEDGTVTQSLRLCGACSLQLAVGVGGVVVVNIFGRDPAGLYEALGYQVPL